jgi:predicted MFS family arabinose efflux permease
MGKWLIAVGLVIAAVGVAVTLGVPFGRLPGDVVVQRGSFTFYAPIVSCVILSLVFTLLLSWLRR